LVVGVDTATGINGVAVVDPTGLLGSVFSPPGVRRRSDLLGMIETALARAGKSLADVALLAVAVGPGSFTGIRVGLGTAQGIADGAGLPLIGVDTLSAMATGAGAPAVGTTLVSALVARKGELYAAFFENDGAGNLIKTVDDRGYTPEDLATAVPPGAVFVGDGYGSAEEIFSSKGRLHNEFGTRPERSGAYGVARTGLRAYMEGRGGDYPPVPRYVKKSQAELNWERLRG
jgi:tRNA threonylcarbamoyladenosine biosynthesis protein TsaB